MNTGEFHCIFCHLPFFSMKSDFSANLILSRSVSHFTISHFAFFSFSLIFLSIIFRFLLSKFSNSPHPPSLALSLFLFLIFLTRHSPHHFSFSSSCLQKFSSLKYFFFFSSVTLLHFVIATLSRTLKLIFCHSNR